MRGVRMKSGSMGGYAEGLERENERGRERERERRLREEWEGSGGFWWSAEGCGC